jgi:glycosyltransferase involved in cell wall biosynthesis
MKILINGSYAPSLLAFRGKLIEALIQRGYEIHVTAPDISDGVRAQLVAMNAHVHAVRLGRNKQNPLADLVYLKDLLRVMRLVNPQMVLNYTVKPNIWGSIAARMRGVKSASMVTGLGFSFYPQKALRKRLVQSIARRLYATATRYNAAVIFQNPDDVRDFVAAGCLADTNKAAIVNGSGVDVEFYAPAPLPPDSVFLMISRFLVSKGLREFAQAGIAVLKERKDCRFVLVGFPDDGVDGVPAEEMDAWRDSGIEFAGQLVDVRPAIAAASVYVLPSYREGTPRTVLEAMAMGRAIITTDAPGCRETVVDGQNGIKVPPQNADALKSAMLKMADSAELRSVMGEQSRQLAVSKYAVDKVNAELMRILSL